MSESQTPAMTPEQWRTREIRDRDFRILGDMRGEIGLWLNGELVGDLTELHALAALCLYQQPFGFTQEDVTLIEQLLGEIDFLRHEAYGKVKTTAEEDAAETAARHLADRIRNLLPSQDL